MMDCIDISEFEKNFDEIVLKRTSPIAVTRDGQFVGHYVPVWHLKKQSKRRNGEKRFPKKPEGHV
jgi:hypothetical protein